MFFFTSNFTFSLTAHDFQCSFWLNFSFILWDQHKSLYLIKLPWEVGICHLGSKGVFGWCPMRPYQTLACQFFDQEFLYPHFANYLVRICDRDWWAIIGSQNFGNKKKAKRPRETIGCQIFGMACLGTSQTHPKPFILKIRDLPGWNVCWKYRLKTWCANF